MCLWEKKKLEKGLDVINLRGEEIKKRVSHSLTSKWWGTTTTKTTTLQ